MNFASYKCRKMSARKGAQLVHFDIPTVCWKTFPAKNHENIVDGELEHLDDVIFRVLVFRIRVLLHKMCFFVP